MSRFAYVGSPISSRNKIIQWQRVQAASEYTAALLRRGIPAFCPAAHSLGLIVAEQFAGRTLPNSWAWWKRADLPILGMATEFHVLMLSGWRKSVGVRAEIAEAKRLGIKVVYVSQKKIPFSS